MVPQGTFGSQNLKSARAGRASRAGARAGRIVRIVRMIKLYKYATVQQEKKAKEEQKQRRLDSTNSKTSGPREAVSTTDTVTEVHRRRTSVFVPVPIEEDEELGEVTEETQEVASEEELPPESHVGAAMSDITTRRVIVLVLSMLIIIPLLNYTPTNLARSFGVTAVHKMAVNNYTSGGLYEVRNLVFMPQILSCVSSDCILQLSSCIDA